MFVPRQVKAVANVNIELLDLMYFQNSYNVPYRLKKGGDIEIKPILVKDYPLYEWSMSVLNIKKNEINDIEIIQMSYLDFLVNKLFVQDENELHKLLNIIRLCLGYESVSFDKDKGKICLLLCNKEGIIEKVINSKEFDDIAKIILFQNDFNYDDRYINPDVETIMQEYSKVKYGDINNPTLEQRKAFVSSKIGKTFSQLNEIPYREFDLIYHSALNGEIYIAQKIIQGSYKYDVKEDIKHPLFEKKKDPYSEVFDDPSVLQNKGIQGASQLNTLNFNESQKE